MAESRRWLTWLYLWVWLLLCMCKHSESLLQGSAHLIAVHRASLALSVGRRKAPSHSSSQGPSSARNVRKLKYARILRDEISGALCNGEVKSLVQPVISLQNVVIESIHLNDGLENAKVFVAISGNLVESRALYVWLNNHSSQIRYALAQRLRHYKFVPHLSFHLVNTASRYALENALDSFASSSSEPNNLPDVAFEEPA